MRDRILGSLACLFAGAVAVLAQPPAPPKAGIEAPTAPPPVQTPEASPAPTTPPPAAPADRAGPPPPFAEGWTLPFLGENSAPPAAAEGGHTTGVSDGAQGHV